MYGAFEQFSGIFALAFTQSRHRQPHDLYLVSRYFALVFRPMPSFALSLRPIASTLKFPPHLVRYTLKRFQFFVSAEFSQRRHAMFESFKNIV